MLVASQGRGTIIAHWYKLCTPRIFLGYTAVGVPLVCKQAPSLHTRLRAMIGLTLFASSRTRRSIVSCCKLWFRARRYRWKCILRAQVAKRGGRGRPHRDLCTYKSLFHLVSVAHAHTDRHTHSHPLYASNLINERETRSILRPSALPIKTWSVYCLQLGATAAPSLNWKMINSAEIERLVIYSLAREAKQWQRRKCPRHAKKMNCMRVCMRCNWVLLAKELHSSGKSS